MWSWYWWRYRQKKASYRSASWRILALCLFIKKSPSVSYSDQVPFRVISDHKKKVNISKMNRKTILNIFWTNIETSVTLISATRRIYKRPFFNLFLHQYQQMDWLMDRRSDGRTDRHILIDFNWPQLTVIDFNWPVLTVFDEETNKKKPLAVDKNKFCWRFSQLSLLWVSHCEMMRRFNISVCMITKEIWQLGITHPGHDQQPGHGEDEEENLVVIWDDMQKLFGGPLFLIAWCLYQHPCCLVYEETGFFFFCFIHFTSTNCYFQIYHFFTP